MKELIIDKLGDNQRLDKYLSSICLPQAKALYIKCLEKRILHLMTRRLMEARNYNQATLSKYFFLMKHLISSVRAKAAYLMLAADRPII